MLDRLCLSVHSGEIVVILGRSGSGKSTLLNLISGIDIPSAGSIRVGDVEISGLNEQERTLFRRSEIGFVFQFFNLIPTLTVGENLLLPLQLNAITGSKAKARCNDLLSAVGLMERKDSFPDLLSGGEQQRVAIARALVHDPPVILADEPTGNLDKETGLKIMDLLDRLVRQMGKTMVVATHSREVIGLADRVLSFSDGRLVERGPEKGLESAFA